LQTVGSSKHRPSMVIGFAAESENLIDFGKQKLVAKNCNLIIANNIENGSIFGSNNTDAYFIEKNKHINLGKISKQELAFYLAQKILSHFETL
jgi:phosphopantothenoylcysteine decarboxylase/phosphopantothenate--cysteine ligase